MNLRLMEIQKGTLNLMIRSAHTLLAASALAMIALPSAANAQWVAEKEIVGQTSTATTVAGGNPLYIAPKPQYSGTVGILMNYGSAGSFVCSGSLVNKTAIVTAAHCVSDGTNARPLSTTVFFYGGADDPNVYAGGPGVVQVGVSSIFVNPLYTGQVVDENDIAILRLAADAPAFAPIYQLSDLTDLTGEQHIVAGYGARSNSGGTNGTLAGSGLGTGRLRYAGNRFDFRFGDADFQGYFDGAFGGAATNNVWISDFDNGTSFRDGSCNIGLFEAANAPAIFSNPVFSSSKYCDTGIGAFEGIGAGGDSGGTYLVNGKLAAVHSFALWYRGDESANRFGQLKGAVSTYFHRNFIASYIPEPSTWAMMLIGFGVIGGAVRRQRKVAVA
jgi:hypothetical protein